MTIVISFLTEKKCTSLKLIIKNVNFLTPICLGSISNKLDAVESREVSLKGNVYEFSIDYGAAGKSNILNIHCYYWTFIS